MQTKYVIKRDGRKAPFKKEKIIAAVKKAYNASEESIDVGKIEQIANDIFVNFDAEIKIEDIQDQVEEHLMEIDHEVAKRFIIYREFRANQRAKELMFKETLDDIVVVTSNDSNHENANMSSETPAGQMMRFASETAKDYAKKYLIKSTHYALHEQGYIHIHDVDYYPSKTTTCIQYNLDKLFTNGFKTKNGHVKEPQSIQSYAALATIVFQTNQNEQHGGQSIPAFDFFMAPGVLKSYRKQLSSIFEILSDNEDLKGMFDFIDSIVPNKEQIARIKELTKVDDEVVKKALRMAYKNTNKETKQAMQSFIYNLNTMHSRGGNQVVFSSINYGTDFSPEGRMVIENILNVTIDGLGNSETPIFPIHVFKVKDDVNYSETDMTKFLDAQMKLEDYKNIDFETPNFDMLVKAMETTSRRLFPNFMFLDTPFNQHEKWTITDPNRWFFEGATMGCRTRVFENIHGEKTPVGRGNLSFTSINLPRLALEAKIELGTEASNEQVSELFKSKVAELVEIVSDQLIDRLNFQKTAVAKQFPFMFGNQMWEEFKENDLNIKVDNSLNSGGLSIGFIGGHNAMVAIYGEGHAENEKAYQTLYETIELMCGAAKKLTTKHNLNISILATPAEGLSGRFTAIDKAKFGEITGVTDKGYYVNSFHVDVKQPISALKKIQLEAPFHALTSAGHISYVELDGEAKKNIAAMAKIIKEMHSNNIGYGSINHPIDRCRDCGYQGIIELQECPKCGSANISRTRRITGYLTGDLDGWNSAKQREEQDRVKHNINANFKNI